MADKEIKFDKKREIGDIFSDSFLFLKQELRPLSKIILFYILPFLVLYAFLQVKAQQKIIGTGILYNPEELFNNPIPFYKNMFIVIIFGIFTQSLYAAAIYSYIELYVKKGKGNFTNSDVSNILFSNSVIAIGAAMVISIISLIGFIMCFIPGIYFANTFSVVLIIAIFEKKGLGQAMQKSWKLVNTQWWNTLLINIVALVIILAIGFVLSIPSMLSGYTSTIAGASQPVQADFPLWYWVLTMVNSTISSLLYIIVYTFLAFQYFNLNNKQQ